MTLIVHIYLYLIGNSSYTVVCSIDIPDYYQSFQFLRPKSMFCCHLSIHKHPCCTTVQECFYCYTFVHIYLFYPNIWLYFSQYFKCPSYFSLFTPLSHYAFQSFYLCTTLLRLSLCGVYCFFSVLLFSFSSYPTF